MHPKDAYDAAVAEMAEANTQALIAMKDGVPMQNLDALEQE
jgi:hypothetical protein